MTGVSVLNLPRRDFLWVAGLILVAVVRIVLTYPTTSQTIDERSHIATGIELLDHGTYTLNQEEPPLARIVLALGPYLSGAVSGDSLQERVHVLNGDAPYPQTLYLARLGNLLFFVLATLIVWAWGANVHDRTTGLLAVALFTFLPAVLAHASVATTDMAATAGAAGAIFSFALWMARPSTGRSVLLGVAVGLACLCKFTTMLFLGAAGMALILVRMGLSLRTGRFPVGAVLRTYAPRAVVAIVIVGVVIWAGYGFSVDPVRHASNRPYVAVDTVLGENGRLHDLAYRAIEAPIYPAPEFFGGIGQMLSHGRAPQTTYLLGETRARGGFWLFFPIAFLVKTPIPFLLFVALGVVVMGRRTWSASDWLRSVPLLTSGAMMLAVIPTGVNVGLRHLLPIYSMVSLVAAIGLLALIRSNVWRQPVVRGVTAALCVWYLLTSVLCHPDYLSYFNAFAGSHPEKVLADSDLDWGQDVGRLSDELGKRRIDEVHLGLFTRAELDHFRWPSHTIVMEPGTRPTGWIAASIYRIKVTKEFAWLEAYSPVETVGHSIRLYFIPQKHPTARLTHMRKARIASITPDKMP